MSLKPPKGFEDPDTRSRAASHVERLIQAWQTEEERRLKMARYRIAQNVIDDKTSISSVQSVIKEIETYQPNLISQRVDGVVGDVCGGYNGQDPYMIYKGTEDDELREAREHDSHLAREADNFPLKVRDIGKTAAVWARGPFWVQYKTEYAGSYYSGEQSGEIEFSGPCWYPIKAEDYVRWPTDTERPFIEGHRFREMRFEMLRLQDVEGGYFDDVIIPNENADEGKHNSETSETDRPLAYHLIVMLRPGDHVDQEAADWEEAKKHPMRAYRMTLLADQPICLALEEYEHPVSEYFAPAMMRDVVEFYPAHSVASKGLPEQIIYNDAITTDILASIAAVKRPVFAGGFVSDMDSIPLDISTLYGFKGKPEFYSPPIAANSGSAMEGIANRMERVTDGAMGQSQVGQGQLPEADQTATATAGALQGQASRTENYAEEFNLPIERAVQFSDYLIWRNWSDFKKFHGDKLKTKSKADWKPRFTVKANGQGPSNNPALTLQKINTAIDAAQKLGLPFAEDVDETAPIIAVSKAELYRDIIDNIDLPSGTENIIIEIERPQPAPAEPFDPLGAGGGGLIPGQEELNGGVSLPPELLDLILNGGGPPGIPPELLAGPALGPNLPIPPMPLELAGQGIDPLVG